VNPHSPRTTFFKWLLLLERWNKARVERIAVVLHHDDYPATIYFNADVEAVGQRIGRVIDQIQHQFLENETNFEYNRPGKIIVLAELLHLLGQSQVGFQVLRQRSLECRAHGLSGIQIRHAIVPHTE
jgi:hypothetical protein